MIASQIGNPVANAAGVVVIGAVRETEFERITAHEALDQASS